MSEATESRFSGQLRHDQVQKLMQSLGDAQILNLDTTVKDLMSTVSPVLRPDAGDGQASFHIVCCNEYGLITQ
jgi:hypothetical protein